MRNRYKRNSYYPKVAEAIGKNYLKLRSLCCVEFDTFHGSLSREDIFQDTVLYVIQDVEASLLESEEDIIKHFCYRYKMIAFQIICMMMPVVRYIIQSDGAGFEHGRW